MKREEIKAIFPDATDEQLKSVMDLNGADVEKSKSKVTALETELKEKKADFDKLNTEFEALKTAKEAGALTICLTNFGNSPIQRYSDIVLNTRSDETKYSILAMSSRIAQLAIFDALYTYIVMNSNKAAVKAIKETETALQSKKY